MRSRLGISAALLASGLSLPFAVPAQADASDDFLEVLSTSGFDVGESGTDVAFALAAATSICALFHWGFTAEDAKADIVYEFPDATPQQLAAFVEAAQSTLCEVAYAPVLPD